jgi:hypothetical protein
MFILDGKPLAPDSPFTHNGIKYPANWLRLTSWEEKEAIGISEVSDPQPVDQRFYWDTDIPKQLEDDGPDPLTGIVTTGLKTQWKQQQDHTAYTLLAPTDWYVVRQTETGTIPPVGITSYRAAVRNICQQRKLIIDTATDVPELIGITTFSGLDWPRL